MVPEIIDEIVLFQRFTPAFGDGPIYSAPVDSRRWIEGVYVGWQGTGLGDTPATVEFTLQHSPDLIDWSDVSGADPGLTLWLVGTMVRRKEGSP